MATIQKEMLYQKWNRCDRTTKIRLACEYLKLLRSAEEKQSWLQFLETRLEAN